MLAILLDAGDGAVVVLSTDYMECLINTKSPEAISKIDRKDKELI